MTNVGIMQPYFLPYIGYLQLIAHVDHFVVYDRIKYTKKGWINRNRLLRNGQPATFSIPLEKAPDHLDVCDRRVSVSYAPQQLENQIKGAYAKAPQFNQVMPCISRILNFKSENLFEYVFHSLTMVCNFLHIDTPIIASSEVESTPNLRGQDRVIGLCQDLGAETYTNPIGGAELYDPNTFKDRGIDLRFIKTKAISYAQFGNEFVPALSILDVMMFNEVDQITQMLKEGYDILERGEA